MPGSIPLKTRSNFLLSAFSLQCREMFSSANILLQLIFTLQSYFNQQSDETICQFCPFFTSSSEYPKQKELRQVFKHYIMQGRMSIHISPNFVNPRFLLELHLFGGEGGRRFFSLKYYSIVGIKCKWNSHVSNKLAIFDIKHNQILGDSCVSLKKVCFANPLSGFLESKYSSWIIQKTNLN